ncbi:MAG: type II toxin-antitoxin system RelE/ParE family toxin, partial [Candidatus Riflebacteria bacterium]|nr:type II toxin-antitoxin system RelE/ParE family toxin [Candidatus Riflebacteria bacterium]
PLMKKYKTKWFTKWSHKKSIADKALLDGIVLVESGGSGVSLGSGLYKIRLAGQSKGKSGGYRTLLIYKKEHIAIYIYGFNKSEQDNINDKELKMYKQLADTFLSLSIADINKAVQAGELIELEV